MFRIILDAVLSHKTIIIVGLRASTPSYSTVVLGARILHEMALCHITNQILSLYICCGWSLHGLILC